MILSKFVNRAEIHCGGPPLRPCAKLPKKTVKLTGRSPLNAQNEKKCAMLLEKAGRKKYNYTVKYEEAKMLNKVFFAFFLFNKDIS